MTCRHAKRKDLDRVCDLLATEFTTEPVHQIIFPDPESRIEKLRDFFRIYVSLAFDYGGTLLTENDTGALLYFRPDAMDMTNEQHIAVDDQLRVACGAHYETATKLIDGLDYYHPKTPPHYYISLLAVQRSRRGGSEVSHLFTTMNTILDKTNTPCYAECTRFSTRTLIRRWDYIDKGSPLHIEGFPALYPIWRNPNCH